LAVVGNPRPESWPHAIARTLVKAVEQVLDADVEPSNH